MQITLQHTELEKAIQAFVLQHVAPQSNAQVIVTLRAGRGEKNFSAVVDIIPHGQAMPRHEATPGALTTKVVSAKRQAAIDAILPTSVEAVIEAGERMEAATGIPDGLPKQEVVEEHSAEAEATVPPAKSIFAQG